MDNNICNDKADEVCGVLCLDKAEGVTSHDMVNKIRRLYGTKKVGHTGTLDPMATGVLPIMIGRAAKAAEFLTADEKEYEAVLRLGLTTDTEDVTGRVLTSSDNLPDSVRVSEALPGFIGTLEQVPPMYSAVKIGGKKLYELARAGVTVEREARRVEIKRLDIEQINSSDYKLSIRCSKGTYIRTLCADIGAALGCGGVMAALRRTASGNFRISDSVTAGLLEKLTFGERIALLSPVESLFSDCESVRLPDFYAALAANGVEIYQKKINTAYPTGTRVKLFGKNGFFALGEVRDYEDGQAIKPIKQFLL